MGSKTVGLLSQLPGYPIYRWEDKIYPYLPTTYYLINWDDHLRHVPGIGILTYLPLHSFTLPVQLQGQIQIVVKVDTYRLQATGCRSPKLV